MTRAVVLAVWAVLAAAMVAVVIIGLVAPRRVAAPGRVGGALTASATLRVVVTLAWMWLGWHLFAR